MKFSVNRVYKSRIFTMIFQDKEKLLELYNAISGKNYTDPELLEINTLGNAIYMNMQNDLSFIIDARLSLYEHQSTVNPNLPLRFLWYISKLYMGIQEGLEIGRIQLIQKKLARGKSISQIADDLECTEEEILATIEEINKKNLLDKSAGKRNEDEDI